MPKAGSRTMQQQQALALPYLARGVTMAEVARRAGTSAKTIERWIDEDLNGFAGALETAKAEAVEDAVADAETPGALVRKVYADRIEELAELKVRIALGETEASPTQLAALNQIEDRLLGRAKDSVAVKVGKDLAGLDDADLEDEVLRAADEVRRKRGVG